MKRKARIIFLSLLMVIILLFPLAGQFLIVNETPSKSDAIILLTGGGVERHELAVSLYKSGFAPVIIVSNSIEDGIVEAVIKQGVPSDAIIQETMADSTYTNAQYTLKIMKEKNLKSALVVSSDYHERRVKFNFGSVFRSSGIRLIYCSAQTEYSFNFWFSNKKNINITFDEYSKLLGNALGFNGNEDKQTLITVKEILGLE